MHACIEPCNTGSQWEGTGVCMEACHCHVALPGRRAACAPVASAVAMVTSPFAMMKIVCRGCLNPLYSSRLKPRFHIRANARDPSCIYCMHAGRQAQHALQWQTCGVASKSTGGRICGYVPASFRLGHGWRLCVPGQGAEGKAEWKSGGRVASLPAALNPKS
eukprot:364931-Chlamydomonas_euryale.AAC.4